VQDAEDIANPKPEIIHDSASESIFDSILVLFASCSPH
jgi:hypothetical protein